MAAGGPLPPAVVLSHVVPSEECLTREPTHLSVCGGGERLRQGCCWA
jgi:hypothetical protein